jgi:dephospho-CoA kinase
LPGVLRVGLTGGIACGRSTVAAMLAAPGRLILDADSVVHALLAEGGAAVPSVAEAFGPAVVAAGGGISRAALGRLVFTDAAARRTLESLLHPMVTRTLAADTESFERRHGSGIVVVDAALMVETGTYRGYHRLLVVHCPSEVQRERLMRRDRLTEAEAEARIAAQAPLGEKIALADYLIDTGGTMDQTARGAAEVARLLEEDLRALPNLAPRRRRGAEC